MIPIGSLLIVLTLSVLITRIGSVALTHTGLSTEAAKFQARSAYTGVGYTTDESEKTVNHPVRRKIIYLLMFLGNVGIVTAISSLVLSFVGESGPTWLKAGFLMAGLGVLWIATTSRWLDRKLQKVIRWALRRYTRLEVHDLMNLLKLQGDYSVTEIGVRAGDWLAHRELAQAALPEEGIVVLGITRNDGTYLGAPDGETSILPGDRLILYGRDSCLEKMQRRREGASGDRERKEAVSAQREVRREEKRKDRASQEKASVPSA
ncbi:MAG: TrkA C-terminal domain-containing protein [Myxococcota bacterium]